MNGIHYSHAKAVSDELVRSATDKRHHHRLLAAVGSDHPLRRRIAHMLIRAGIRLSPQPIDLIPAPRTAGS